jgi:hypothetical protein
MRSIMVQWTGLTRGELATTAAIRGGRLAERAIQGIDRVLRRWYGVYEFTDDRECIIRIALRAAGRDIPLRHGILVRSSDAVVELHLWNEQLPLISHDGVDMTWGAVVDRHVRRSLTLLAAHLAAHPNIAAVHGETAFGCQMGELQRARFAARYGFEIVGAKPGLGRLVRHFCDDFVVWVLTRTFNPHGTKGKPFHRARHDIWMSRAELDRRWGAGATGSLREG